MAKRSPAMKNDVAIQMLLNAKAISQKNDNGVCCEYATVFKSDYEYSSFTGNYVNVYKYFWNVPLEVWKKHVNPRFKPEFKIGTQVRVRQESKRDRVRNGYKQFVGNSQNFRHLGLGTGKAYITDRLKQAYNTNYFYRWMSGQNSNRIKIGNNWIPNALQAINHKKWCDNNGIQKKDRWMSRKSPVEANEFLDTIIIKADGILGPKTLINGYVTNVFIHWIEPTWERKREARYEITFDNGVKGIWTNDYINQVYDTDYELDEKLMDGCPHSRTCQATCDHRDVHMYNSECDTACYTRHEHKCEAIYDYTNLCDMAHGTGMEMEGDDD